MACRLGVCGACGGVSDWHRFYDFLRFTLVETHNMHKPEKKKKINSCIKTSIPKKKNQMVVWKACLWCRYSHLRRARFKWMAYFLNHFLIRNFVSHLRRSINRGFGESATKGIEIWTQKSRKTDSHLRSKGEKRGHRGHVNEPVMFGADNWYFSLKDWTPRLSHYSHRRMIPMNVDQVISKKHRMKLSCPGRPKPWKLTCIEQQIQNCYH